jgi:hypothetical protein
MENNIFGFKVNSKVIRRNFFPHGEMFINMVQHTLFLFLPLAMALTLNLKILFSFFFFNFFYS